MRIILLIQRPQLRGAEVFACQLGDQLISLGHNCKIVTLFQGNANLPFGGEVVHLNRPQNKRLWDWTGWKEFAKMVRDEKPDVVQANAGDTLKFAVLSKVFFGLKTPIIFRNASTISMYIKSPWVLWFNRLLFRRTASVISVSQFTKKDFITLFPFLKDNIEVIPIGVALSGNEIAQRESGYLLHVGGFSFEKNHIGLLKIFKQVVQVNPGLELWLIGDGPLRGSIEKSVEEFGLTNQVRFLGYQKEVFPFMKSARVLILPSIIEGLPGVILEAMVSRLPVVAYDVGGIPEVVKTGETGWLVKAGDEAEFARAVLDVLESPKIDKITMKAYKMVMANFDNRIIAKRFLEVYRITSKN